MTKTIEQHEAACAKDRASERHDFIDNRIQPQFTILHSRIDKLNEKIEPIKGDNILHKEKLNSMDKKLDKLTTAFEDLAKEMRDNTPSKKEVEGNTTDIKELKKDRIKFLIWIVTSALGIIATLITVIYNK